MVEQSLESRGRVERKVVKVQTTPFYWIEESRRRRPGKEYGVEDGKIHGTGPASKY